MERAYSISVRAFLFVCAKGNRDDVQRFFL